MFKLFNIKLTKDPNHHVPSFQPALEDDIQPLPDVSPQKQETRTSTQQPVKHRKTMLV